MEMSGILSELNTIVSKVLDDDTIVLRENTTVSDVAGWDSLSHVQIIVAIEKHFHIKFTSLEIYNFKNVGDACRVIQKKLSNGR